MNPSLAILEVMDKEPSILSFWISALLLGGIGFVLARRRWWLAVPVLVILALGIVGVWNEWTDTVVGPAIAEEAGRMYPWHAVSSAALALGLTVAGMLRRLRRVEPARQS